MYAMKVIRQMTNFLKMHENKMNSDEICNNSFADAAEAESDMEKGVAVN